MSGLRVAVIGSGPAGVYAAAALTRAGNVQVDVLDRLPAPYGLVRYGVAPDHVKMKSVDVALRRILEDPAVRFLGHVPARFGFSKGRLLVVPSRGDSMPYVVIEAGAAGVPMLAANIGGIPEILGPFTDALVTPNDPDALATAIATAIDEPAKTAERAKLLRERVFQHFSQAAMVEGILKGYRDAFLEH